MKPVAASIALIFLALAAYSPTLAQNPPAPAIRATSSEVLLDFVVRDKKGKLVKNLKAADIEVLEDGARQELKSFRLVSSRDAQQQRTTPGALLPGQPGTRPLRAVNLVCIVMHNLDPVSRRQAMLAIQEFLQGTFPPNSYFGVFNLDDRISAIYPFTNNRDEVIQAAKGAFRGRAVDFARASEAVITASPNLATVSVAVDLATHSANVDFKVTGGEISQTAITGAEVSTGEGATRVRGDQVRERSDFGNLVGMRETDKIINMVNQLGSLPGRKSVLLISTGLVTNGDPERFQAILNNANKRAVTVYAFDVTGLNETSTAQAGNIALGQVTSTSRGQGQIATGTVAADGGGSLGEMKQKSRQGDDMQSAVRTSDVQASLRALSDGTGGFMIANTNDYRKPFQHIVDDLETHYETSYRPSSDKYDGRLRTIEIKPSRADLAVESRTGYFAMPDLKSTAPALPHEATALAILNARQPPHAFEFRASAFQFRNEGALAIELPGTSLTATPRPERKTSQLHASLLALVHDSSGQVVDKFVVDAPYEIPDANLATIRASSVTYTHPVSLPAGKYSLEAAVLDREGTRASAGSTPFEVSATPQGVGMSSLVLVQGVEPVNGTPDPADPLVFQGRRLIPLLATTLNPDAKPMVYFVVYPDRANPEKPKLEVELSVGGQVKARQAADLPAPDASGAIPMVVRAPLQPGSCVLRIKAIQGTASTDGTLNYAVAAK